MNTKIQKELLKFKRLLRRHLYLEDDRMVDVALAGYVANLLPGDPVWLILIAPPSSTKTEILNMFNGYKYTFTLSTLTENTLLSGQKRRSKDDPEPSLLFQLGGKVLVLKDFTSILSMRDNCIRTIVAQLREIYDGYLEKGYGTGKLIRWRGKMGLLAACTPSYDAHYGIIGPLGDRFLLYRDHITNGSKMAMIAMQQEGREQLMRSQFQKQCHKFLDMVIKYVQDVEVSINPIVMNKLINLSEYAAYARTLVQRNTYSKELEADASPEGPARLAKNLSKLGKALALIQGRDEITTPVYNVLKKVGKDLVPKLRHRILYALWRDCINRERCDYLSVADVVQYSGVPKSTTRVILQDLYLLGIVEFKEEQTRFKYRLSERCFQLIADSEVFI